MPQQTFQVVDGLDDAFDFALPQDSPGFRRIEATADRISVRQTGFDPDIGLVRFRNLPIPQGSTINFARLECYNYPSGGTTDLGPFLFTAYGHDTDDAPPVDPAQFSTFPSVRTRTTAIAPGINDDPAPGDYHVYGDLAPCLQEVVNRPGWASGNAFAAIIVQTTQPCSTDIYEFASFEFGQPARLIVDWDPPDEGQFVSTHVD